MRSVFLSVLACTLLTACTSYEAGDSCEGETSALCDSKTQALFCDNGSLRAVECRGPAGCVEGDDSVVCDFTNARAGDACPNDVANQAQCNAGNANEALRCTSNVWTVVACKACAVQGGQVVCQP
jgi:hypothetical protein